MKKILSLLKYFINLFWGVIFFLFASVQFNDPDPMTWILVYTLTAILCFLYLNTKTAQKIRWVYVLTAVGLLMGSYNEFPPQWEGFGTSMKTENNELARESTGLLLCGLVLLTQSVFLFGDINKQR